MNSTNEDLKADLKQKNDQISLLDEEIKGLNTNLENQKLSSEKERIRLGVEYQTSLEQTRQEEAEKYQGFIDPTDQVAIRQVAEKLGYRFKQADITEAVNKAKIEKDQEYQNYQSPSEVAVWEAEVRQNQTEMKGKIQDAERERDLAIKERDQRANITKPEYERLLSEKNTAESDLSQ